MTANNSFSGLGDMLGNGFDASLTSDAVDIPELDLELIEIVDQEREEFEDDDNSLLELGNSMRTSRQWQQILVRPMEGCDKPYELVAGERRYRAARLVGMTTLRAFCVPMTDEEAADARFAENIQRKNLTLIEEARRLKKDVDQLGIQATLVKCQKSQAWVSKRLQLLNLPESAQRLVTEHISADIELINQVRQIEKRDPSAAAELVDGLKATRGKERGRDKVAAVKEKVKGTGSRSNTEGSVAAPINKTGEPPSKVRRFAVRVAGREEPSSTPRDDEPGSAPADAPENTTDLVRLLTLAFDEIWDADVEPDAILSAWSDADRDTVESHLRELYHAGRHSMNAASLVLHSLRRGTFDGHGGESFGLAAFITGVNGASFSVPYILGTARPSSE